MADYPVKKKTGYRFPEMSEKNYPSDETLDKYGPTPKVKRVKKVKSQKEVDEYGSMPRVFRRGYRRGKIE